MGEQKGDILFSGVRPTKAFLKRYTGEGIPQPSHQGRHRPGSTDECKLLQKRSSHWA